MAEEEQYQKVANRKDLKEVGLLKIEPNRKSIISAMVMFMRWIRYAHIKVVH